MTLKKFFVCVTALLAAIAIPLTAQEPAAADTLRWTDTARTIFNLIYTDPAELPTITLVTDIKQLIRKKDKEEYQPLHFSFTAADGKIYEWDLEVRPRGNRRKEVCYFPPVKLNFDKKALKAEGFLPFDQIKIAHQCRTGGFEGFLFKEYLAYELYNRVTPESFRTRLVRLVYQDQAGEEPTEELYAIIIEPAEELAARVGGELVELSVTRYVNLEKDAIHRVFLFQYMIGNTDWHITNAHNLITIKLPEDRKLTPVPYDFDYAGMVNAPYAVPHESLPIKVVTDHYNKGDLMTMEELEEVMPLYRRLQPELEATCQKIAPFNERAAKEAGQFLDYFFKVLEKDKWMEAVFVKGRQ